VRKVFIYSLLLIGGLIVSQFIGDFAATPVRLLLMVALSFIMIHVGYEFEIDKSRPRQYAWDYFVAFTAAAFPWVFCAAYFVYVMAPAELWSHPDLWKEALLEARFASPTSAGVLFAMLAAAGLGATWVFNKARVLAIFDDLDTILLMIPLQIMMVGLRWQLGAIVLIIVPLLWLAWRYLHALRWPIRWPWVMTYAVGITVAAELMYLGSQAMDPSVPVHLEVLLPAFVLGCVLARPPGANPHADDTREGVEEGPEAPEEQRVSTIVSACFMVLVGLSMPPIRGHAAATAPPPAPAAGAVETDPAAPADETPARAKRTLEYADASPEALAAKARFPGWGPIALHVLAITFLSNLGKMFPAFCYRREASFRERLAVSIGMWPRGEVGAGVLVISLSYGLAGPALTVAVLSLALNLLCTGLFIVVVKKLLAHPSAARGGIGSAGDHPVMMPAEEVNRVERT
jgi:Kef-type K+ transport system membrane component KefB